MTDAQILKLAHDHDCYDIEWECAEATAFTRGFRTAERQNNEVIKLKNCLSQMLGVISAHGICSENCNGTDDICCDCLDREIKRAEELLSA